MNCKKGDMALIVRSRAGNHGRVVTCLEYLGEIRHYRYGSESIFLCKGHWWRVDRKVNLIQGGVITENCAPLMIDENMIPIGRVDDQVEVEEDVPIEETA